MHIAHPLSVVCHVRRVVVFFHLLMPTTKIAIKWPIKDAKCSKIPQTPKITTPTQCSYVVITRSCVDYSDISMELIAACR